MTNEKTVIDCLKYLLGRNYKFLVNNSSAKYTEDRL